MAVPQSIVACPHRCLHPSAAAACPFLKRRCFGIFPGLSARNSGRPRLEFHPIKPNDEKPDFIVEHVLEYRFFKRLSLQTGVAKSSKLYTATGEQYQWPDAWYSQKVRPTEIDAVQSAGHSAQLAL